MSAISMSAMDTTSGRTRRNRAPDFVLRQPKPTSKLPHMAIAVIKTQAANGIRFHQAACVYPCEFNTSFIPNIARTTMGGGCAPVGARTIDHNSERERKDKQWVARDIIHSLWLLS
jgi:hypothetical protein